MIFDTNSEPAEPLFLQRVFGGSEIFEVQCSRKWSKNQRKINEKMVRKIDREKMEKARKLRPKWTYKS